MAPSDGGGDGAPVVWLSLEGLSTPEAMRDAATAGIESGAACIVVPHDSAEAVGSLARVRLLSVRDGDLLEEGNVVGSVMRIDSRRDVEGAIAQVAMGRTVLLETPDWTVIPLEDLVAARHGEGLSGRALALVNGAEEAKLALGALEHGVDGVVLRPSDPADVKPAMASLMKESGEGTYVALSVGTVVRVEELGLGDRACVDTVDILREGEGLLVGSSSGCLLLVHGETIENPYAAVRPFRVNAGAVHSYVLAPGSRTLYLSEAASGVRVLLVDRDGQGRASHVGRLKIERRPLVLVEVEVGGRTFNAILQNAETVRLVTPAGHASVSGLEVGQKVVVYTPHAPNGAEGDGTTGRHFGRAVPERIIED